MQFNEAERRYLYKEFLGATQLGESLLVATSSGLVFLKATTGEEEKTWVEKKTGQNDLVRTPTRSIIAYSLI